MRCATSGRLFLVHAQAQVECKQMQPPRNRSVARQVRGVVRCGSGRAFLFTGDQPDHSWTTSSDCRPTRELTCKQAASPPGCRQKIKMEICASKHCNNTVMQLVLEQQTEANGQEAPVEELGAGLPFSWRLPYAVLLSCRDTKALDAQEAHHGSNRIEKYTHILRRVGEK
ncbi:hypothetical protein BKA61DRAFT_169898 [Leptodontidium sp. MPI-SDFR-AT-0119]|nr:hypothetical protein BKA61DRAFT_169898 [Leptodontidium sp. MPI-SDFR-AT-0119]